MQAKLIKQSIKLLQKLESRTFEIILKVNDEEARRAKNSDNRKET